MKIAKTFLVAWSICMACGSVCYADRAVGDTIFVSGVYYKIVSFNPHVVAVTHDGSYNNGTLEYTSVLTIPQTVTKSGSPDTTYTVKYIGELAFANCSTLTKITLPNTVDSLGKNAFRSCAALTEVVAPNLTKFGDRAFIFCSSLTTVPIHQAQGVIDAHAFHGATALTSVTIPSTVTQIGANAFEDCTGLKKITVSWTNPNQVTVGNDAFKDIPDKDKILLKVTPITLTDAYKNVSPWKDFLIPQAGVSSTAITLPAVATTSATGKKFKVRANVGWKITSNQSWCSVSLSEGVAQTVVGDSTEITVYASSANTGATARTATLTIAGKNNDTIVAAQPITVTQYPQPISTDEYIFSAYGGLLEIPVKVAAGVSWSATKTGGTWFRITSPAGGTGIGEGTIILKADTNISEQMEGGALYVTVDGTSYTKPLKQDIMTLYLSEHEMEFSKNGGERSVTLFSTSKWKAIEYPTWITLSPRDSGLVMREPQTYKIIVDPCKTVTSSDGERLGNIVFRNGDTTDTLKVWQLEPTTELKYTPNDFTFNIAAGKKTITVTSNANWVVEVSDVDKEWVSVSPAKGSGNGSFDLIVKENNSKSVRDGKVTIKGGTAVHPITFTQTLVQATPDSVTLNYREIEIRLGDKPKALIETVYPVNTSNKNVTWASDKNEVVSVLNGVLIAHKVGTSVVRVFTEVGNKTAACLVIVVPSDATEAVADAARVTLDQTGRLTVNTPVAEQVTVYAVGGALLWQAQKEAGEATFDVRRLPQGMLIVGGSSGWSEKALK